MGTAQRGYMLLLEESSKLLARIDSGENLTFVRYGDGEVLLACGQPVGKHTQAALVDRWHSDGGMTSLGYAMRLMLTHPEWVYGIPCQCCNDGLKKSLLSMMENIPSVNITFANMFVNAAFPNFERWVKSITRSVVLVTNVAGKNRNFPFKVDAHLLLPDDCVSQWEYQAQHMINVAEHLARSFTNTLFLFSGGPLKVLLHYMYEANPRNVYLDVGSAIDQWVHGRQTRPYHNRAGGSPYTNRNCLF